MKQRIDWRLVGALLRRRWQEGTNAFLHGKDRQIAAPLLRLVLAGAFIALFVVFFGRFVGLFVSVKQAGAVDVPLRTHQLLTMVYTLLLFFLVLSAMGAINREMFLADDVRLFAAMPVGADTLFVAKLLIVYLGQFAAALFTLLPLNLTLGLGTGQGAWFWGNTALLVVLFPLMSIAIASFFALPYYFIRQFLNTHSVLYFLLIAAGMALGFAVYALLLGGVKEILLGNDLRYFFDERAMNAIARVVAFLYPAHFFADWMLRTNLLAGGLGTVLVLLVFLGAALVLIRALLQRMLRMRIAGTPNFIGRPRPIAGRMDSFFALLKKEFLGIFRTPSYAFSYFSVAVVMPLMVYFCMSIGSSLVTKLIGVDASFELAILLTLLFGSLTNTFCSTNISREGPMFYSLKAMPLSWQKVIFSKVVLCLLVSALSQLVSAVLLVATGYVGVGQFFFLFAIGVLSGFSQIALATRFDFDHARFYTEDDAEASENGNTVSAMIVISLVYSFLIGGAVVYLRMLDVLSGGGKAWLTYLVAGGVVLASVALSTWYLVWRLGKKYYEFSGGGGI